MRKSVHFIVIVILMKDVTFIERFRTSLGLKLGAVFAGTVLLQAAINKPNTVAAVFFLGVAAILLQHFTSQHTLTRKKLIASLAVGFIGVASFFSDVDAANRDIRDEQSGSNVSALTELPQSGKGHAASTDTTQSTKANQAQSNLDGSEDEDNTDVKGEELQRNGVTAQQFSAYVASDYDEAHRLLDSLEVKGRAPKTGYDRAKFGQRWVDLDRNGCDTRNDILGRDLLDVQVKPGTRGCKVLNGRLKDPYTGKVIAFTRGPQSSPRVQIDHVVALLDAWQKAPKTSVKTNARNSPTIPSTSSPLTEKQINKRAQAMQQAGYQRTNRSAALTCSRNYA